MMADHEIIHGDCIPKMGALERYAARLVVADPPYNLGVDYGCDATADDLSEEEYRQWTVTWLLHARTMMSNDGSLWVIVPDEWAALVDETCRIYLNLIRRNWIKWYETFGVNCFRKFNRTSRHILYYVRDEHDFIFDAYDPVIRRMSDRQTKYKDKRANPNGKVLDDVWIVPRVAGTHKERCRWAPTQIPLEITRRIVCCASNPGDLVLDPFSGTASTGVAALEGGRRYIGIEKNAEYCERSRERLAVVSRRDYYTGPPRAPVGQG